MAGRYPNGTDLFEDFSELDKQLDRTGPCSSKTVRQQASGGLKKQLTPEDAAEIVSKYKAGASMSQLKVEHHMAKRTVAKVLREAGVTIRPRGGRRSIS